MPSSGAGGPCCHCGRTNSCCWRRGPSNKPILCNACGSRYLVKRNLDNYVPLATRQDRAAANKDGSSGKEAAARRTVAPAAGRISKPKRVAHKRVDSDGWSSEAEESDVSASEACMTDDSAASQGTAAMAPPRAESSRAAAAASKLKLSYITSQSQLKELDSADLSSLASAFFVTSTMRIKPRKPVVVTVSAVW